MDERTIDDPPPSILPISCAAPLAPLALVLPLQSCAGDPRCTATRTRTAAGDPRDRCANCERELGAEFHYCVGHAGANSRWWRTPQTNGWTLHTSNRNSTSAGIPEYAGRRMSTTAAAGAGAQDDDDGGGGCGHTAVVQMQSLGGGMSGTPVTAEPGIDMVKVTESQVFKDWVASVDADPLLFIKAVHVQSLDMFGPRVGFIKFRSTACINVGGEEGVVEVPGIVFMRGGAVGVLVILECEGKE